MAKRTGYLTIYSADRAEIYGEFSDGTWETEDTEGGSNHLFSGTASEGTLATFRRINVEGIDHVVYDFESDGVKYTGEAQMLTPQDTGTPGVARVRIETGAVPKQIVQA